MKQCIKILAISVFTLSLEALTGCGGGGMTAQSSPSTPVTTTPQSTTLTVLVKDAPADNVGALAMNFSGVQLQGTGTAAVTLSGGDQALELRHLELAPTVAFVGSPTSVSNYDSLNVALDSPELTVTNTDGTVQRLSSATTPSVRLASNSVKVAMPSTMYGMDTVVLDFDIAKSISTDAYGNYIITPTITAEAATSNPTVLVPGLVGNIVGNSGGQLSVQLENGVPATFVMDAATVYSSGVSGAEGLASGQSVEVDAAVLSDGRLSAQYVRTPIKDTRLREAGVVTAVTTDSAGNEILRLMRQQ